MSSVSGAIPNLIGGVSQRPPEIRALNTSTLLNNVWLSPSIGLTTRPNLVHTGSFGDVPGADDFVSSHTISKPSGNYQISLIDGALKVMDLDTGSLDTVNTTASLQVTSIDAQAATGDGEEYVADLLTGQTVFEVVISGITTATVIIEESSTGAWAGEETTVATKTADETFDITATDGYYYRASVSAWTSGTITVVFNTDPYDYINAGSDAQNLGFLTIGDTTFLYNKAVNVSATTTSEPSTREGITEDSVVRLNPNLFGTVWIKQRSTVNDYYTIYINNTKVAEYNADAKLRDTVVALHAAIGIPAEAADADIFGDSIISIELTNETDWCLVDGPEGSIESFNDFVDEFADLTKNDREGRLVLVRQDAGEDADDYWVWFKGGSWEETYGWNSYEQLNAWTMPHTLVDNLDGTWTLSEHTWAGRDAGDTNSNPTPSFVGNPVNNMFLYKGRMCILSDENVIASGIADFENFYRTTCTQLLDDDRFDVASPESRGGQLFHAVEFNKSLLMMSGFDQFALTGDAEGNLSPNTVSIEKVNSYNVADHVSPVFAGPNVVFVDDFENTSYAKVQEYQVERVFGREVALPLTDSVPEYIPSGIYQIAEGSSQNTLLFASEGDRTKLWVYQYYYNNEGKVQSSWSEWAFGGSIYSAEFLEDVLVLTMKFNGDLEVAKMTFHTNLDAVFDDDSVLYDLRVHSDDLTVVYAAGNTTVTLPYSADFSTQKLVVSPGDVAGVLNPGTVVTPDSDDDGNDLVFEGVDLSGTDFMVGLPYTIDWTLNPIYIRDDKGVPIQDGRLQLRYLSFLYSQTHAFTVTVTPAQRSAVSTDLTSTLRDAKIKAHSGIQVGNADTVVGTTGFVGGKFRVPCYGRAEDTLVEVSATTPWRVTFSSAEWEGTWRPKTKRA